MSSSSTTISVRQTPKRQKPAKAPRSKAVKKKKSRRQRSTNNNLDKDCYARILNDPFNNPPCKIGYNCMVPSITGSMFYRSTIPCNADGSLAFCAMPTLGQTGSGVHPLFFSNSGAAVVAWSGLAWQNLGQYPTTITDMCRVLSVGLRLTPLVAATATPGICLAGAVPGESVDEIVTNSPNAIGQLSTLTNFVTSNNVVEINSRPIDNTAYEFTTLSYKGSNSASYSHSSPLVVFTGYPATANVLVEAILHFEYLPVTTTFTGRSQNSDLNPDEKNISSAFSSFEDMWRYTSEHLNPTAVVDFGSSAINFLSARAINGMLRGGGQNRLM